MWLLRTVLDAEADAADTDPRELEPSGLGDLFRQLHHDQSELETITPAQYLDRHPTNQVATPSATSWGHEGYNAYWVNESNAWVYRHLHRAGERMKV